MLADSLPPMQGLSVVMAVGSAALALVILGVFEAARYLRKVPPPSAEPTPQRLGTFEVNPERVKAGSPTFRGVETSRSPDGRHVTGLWACAGPAVFEWSYGVDETIHLLEGRVDLEYLGRSFTVWPGDTVVFHAGTRALWHVPEYAKKVFTLSRPNVFVRGWRKLFAART